MQILLQSIKTLAEKVSRLKKKGGQWANDGAEHAAPFEVQPYLDGAGPVAPDASFVGSRDPGTSASD